MKKKLLFLATFAVGVIVGIVSQLILVHTSPPDKCIETKQWSDTEEKMLERMQGFQTRLDQLESVGPDSVEALSKQTEAQRGIVDLLTKYREAKQAKFAPYTGFAGNVAAALIGIIGTWIATRLVARRKSKSTPHASLQT